MKGLPEVRQLQTDVLIIGAGVAGMMAAIGANRSGVTPVIATKGTYASGSSSMARGGHAVALGHSDPADNPELFFEDIRTGSEGLGNPRLIDLVSTESIARSAELDAWGLGLVKLEDGRYDQKFAGYPHRYARMVHCGRLMGKPLMAALSARTQRGGGERLEHVILVDLLRDGPRVIGAWGFLSREGVPLVIHARSTVLATGGAAQLHALNDSPPVITGDGYAMAYRAGAELIDMEFIDYQIIAAAPPKMAGYPPYSTGLLGGGGYLRNAQGDRFMERYDPEKKERTTRAMINRALAIEVMEGRGTEIGSVYIDIRHVFDEINKGAAAEVIGTFAKNGVDLRTGFLEVTSAPHTYLGGVRIDEWGRTSIEGLYAGGEAAGGIHGANRLGGLAFIDSYVFGLRAGIAAAREAATREAPDPDRGGWKEGLEKLAERSARAGGSRDAEEWRCEVQRLVVSSLGQVRREDRLREGLAGLARLEQRFNEVRPGGDTVRARFDALTRLYETGNLIEVARMLGTAALQREETRGGHFRLDFPERNDDRFLGNYVVRREDGQCRADLRPVPPRDAVAPPPPGDSSTESCAD